MRSVRSTGLAGIVVGLIAIVAPGAVAQGDGVITVAGDGSGDFDTISGAIGAAAHGDTIVIAPGTYVEGLVIDKDLTLSGQGARADVVIEPPEDLEKRLLEYEEETGPVVIYAEDSDFAIEHVTLGPVVGYGLAIIGGSATIHDIATEDTIIVRGEAVVNIDDSDIAHFQAAGSNVSLVRGSIIRDGATAWEDAQAMFQDNEVLGFPLVADGSGRLDASGNTFRPTADEPGVVIADPESVGTIVDNEFSGGWVGVLVEYADEALVEGNVIDGAAIGIVTVEGSAIVRGNTVSDAGETGIVTVGEGSTIVDNVVRGGRVGLHAQSLPGDMHPRAVDHQTGPFIEGNTITGATHFGVIVEDAPAELSGNTICGARESLKIEGEANLILGTNDICEPEDE